MWGSLYHVHVFFVLIWLSQATDPPNIIFIVADDMGYNDIGYNNEHLVTPNMDALAKEGVILDQTYMQPVCTPSRSAFLSGKYPFRSGMQGDPLENTTPHCLPVELPLLPQRLKDLGYSTHLVGKWHLGFCNRSCLPTSRGFDSFYGFYNGGSNHFDHIGAGYLDLHDNDLPVTNETDNYSTHLFTREAIERINAHDGNTPLFMELAYQAPHSPLQNGGMPKNGGNNYPLRGAKALVYEGGTRMPAFVHSPLLSKTNYKNQGMMHAVDWFATILSMGGGTLDGLAVDGVDQTDLIMNGGVSNRNEFVYNLARKSNPFKYEGAIRSGEMKLIIGRMSGNIGWYAGIESGMTSVEPTDTRVLRQLFNLTADPYETNNLVTSHRDEYNSLRAKLELYLSDTVDPTVSSPDPAAEAAAMIDSVWTTGWCTV